MAKRTHLLEDIKPVSEFRAHAASLIQQVRERKRPLVLTQHGHSAAVLLDVADYEALIEEVELLRDVQTAVREIDSGKGIPHENARKRLLKAIRR